MSKRCLTKEQLAQALEDYKNGILPKVIAERFNVHVSAIQRRVREAGMSRGVRRPPLAKEKQETIVVLTRTGNTQKRISQQLGIHIATVAKYQAKLGRRSDLSIKAAPAIRMTVAKRKRMKDLYRQRVPIEKICEETGLRPGTVYYHLRGDGLTKRFKQNKKPQALKSFNLQLTLKHMTDAGLSQTAIAKKLGVDYRTVARYQRRLNCRPQGRRRKKDTKEFYNPLLKPDHPQALSLEKRQGIIRLTKAGLTQPWIGRKLGVGRNTVARYQSYYGIAGYRHKVLFKKKHEEAAKDWYT